MVGQPFTRQAYDLFICLYDTTPGSDDRRRAIALREWVATRSVPGAGPLVLYYCALRAYENGATDVALALVKEYRSTVGANRTRATILKAMCEARTNRFDEALRTLADTAAAEESEELAAETLFLRGWIFFQQGKSDQARTALQDVLRRFPRAPASQRAKAALDGLAEDAGDR
jgi:TolA-binding protein